ncbi:MAG: NAD+ synthase [Bacteroidota bacterium]
MMGVMESRPETESPPFDGEIITETLVRFLREEVAAAGLRSGVLGLSGGVDSSVAACLAAHALGAENVLGVMMPYRTSSPASREDALLVAGSLGIRTETVDITPMVDACVGREPAMGRVRAGNVMARQRMVILYDISSRERGLVIGTSNRTEILLGYGTIYGDTACALNPLGDLYKTQVWRLAAFLGLPPGIISKAPSADLWEGQTDEDELGLRYRDVDRLLVRMVDGRADPAALLQEGFDPRLIRRVGELIAGSAFKRRPPLIGRINRGTGPGDSPERR